MRRLATIVLISGLMTFAAYAALWAISGFWDRDGAQRNLDSARGETDLYRTSMREFAYRLPAFCEGAAASSDNLFFFGGSTGRAMRPGVLSPLLPGWLVSSAYMDFGNVTQTAQGIKLVQACLPPDAFRRARFAICMEFMVLSPNARRWPTPYTMLELDLLRHGLFEGPPGAVAPVLSWHSLPAAISIMRPVLAAYGLFAYGQSVSSQGVLVVGNNVLDQAPQAVEKREMQGMSDQMGPALDDNLLEQEAVLQRVVKEVRAAGSDVIIIDMPIADWIAERSPYERLYKTWMHDFVARNQLAYVDISADRPREDFIDGLHATRLGERRWSEAAAPMLQKILQTPESQGR